MSEDPTKRFPESPDDKIDRLVRAVEALSNEVATLRAEVATSRSELSALSQTVEHRLYDTRPMWEAVLAEMENLNNRVDVLETTVRDGLKDMGHLFFSNSVRRCHQSPA